MVIATDAAARKSFFSLPNEVFDDPYFTREKHAFSRLEALAWIAKHVRWKDNCVLKRGEGQWSLSFMAEAWGWHVSKVRRFLKRLEEANIIRTARDRASDIAQVVITYLFSTTSKVAEDVTDIEPTAERHSSDTKTNTGNPGKEDSPYSPPEGDEDPMAGLEPQPQRAAGAGPSKSPPDPQPQAAPAGAGSPPNSAAPPSRKSRERKQARLVPSDWVPSDATVVKMTDEVKATMVDIETERRRFVDYSQSTGRKYVELDSAFRNWLRNWAERRAKAMPQWKTAKEREFCI